MPSVAAALFGHDADLVRAVPAFPHGWPVACRDNLVVEELSYEKCLDHLERAAYLVLDDLQAAHPDVFRVERHSDTVGVCGPSPSWVWTGMHPEDSRAQEVDWATDWAAETVQE